MLFSSTLLAEEDFFIEEDSEFDATEVITTTSDEKLIDLDRSHRFSIAYQLGTDISQGPDIRAHQLDFWYRWDKLLNDAWYAKLDAKLIAIGPKDIRLSDNENIEPDWLINALNIQWSHQQTATTFGFQSIMLGELDTLPVNDVLSPWDYSQQAFTNPEDSRIGQVAIDHQWFIKANHSIRFVFVPIPDVNRYPAQGLTELFSLAPTVSIDKTLPYEDVAWEAILISKLSFSAVDTHILLGRLHSNDPVLEFVDNDKIKAKYPSFEIVGFSVNYNWGNFLWKIEGNFQNDVPLSGTKRQYSDSYSLGAGFDYDANGRYQLSFETRFSELLDPPTTPLGQVSSTKQSALRFSKDLLNELVNLIYFVSYDWTHKDQIHSAYASYKITDHWLLSAGFSLFHIPDKESPMEIADKWDQFTVTVTHDL